MVSYKITTKKRPTDIRLWEKVEKTETCWLWRGSVSRDGYGRIRENGKCVNAHRVAWEITNGPIPEGLWALHKCDVRNCVNPAHLFLGTQLDNMRDASAKGRKARKLSDAQIEQLRRRYAAGELSTILASEFGITASSVSRIARGERRMYVDGPRISKRVGRCPGEKNPSAKMKETDVLELLSLRSQGASYAQLQKRFGLTKSGVCMIASGRTWKHIQGRAK